MLESRLVHQNGLNIQLQSMWASVGTVQSFLVLQHKLLTVSRPGLTKLMLTVSTLHTQYFLSLLEMLLSCYFQNWRREACFGMTTGTYCGDFLSRSQDKRAYWKSMSHRGTAGSLELMPMTISYLSESWVIDNQKENIASFYWPALCTPRIDFAFKRANVSITWIEKLAFISYTWQNIAPSFG